MSDLTDYQISVFTGNVNGAGTDANVFLTLYGSRGSSDELQLDSEGDDFERASTSVFTYTLEDLGDLRKVRVRHDNSGARPGWFLSRILVRDMDGDREWTFPCSLWLATDEFDEQIDRTLDLA
ncbi:PLAT/LH2 domain-containing protein [Streptomyces sp. NPDC001941]|uniref:PLAT/LH2 domain-containing protein n=1 Tax=Streptomyces sp. NPDC001941 TaxID=3154659 RepID=UPI003320075F